MGPRCSSAETQVCHRSYIIAANLTLKKITQWIPGGRHRRARMVVGFTTTYAISAYHH